MILNILVAKLAGLFLLAALGWGLVRSTWASAEDARSLARWVIDVTMPALFFIGIIKLSGTGGDWWKPFLGGFVTSVLALLLGWSLTSLKKIDKIGTFLFSVAIGNSSFLPLPLAQALWGEKGLNSCIFYILGNNIFLFSIGIYLFAWDRRRPKSIEFKRIFLHPQSLASLAALLWRWTGWNLEPNLAEAIDLLGKATLPLAMLATGGFLASIPGKISENKGYFMLSGLGKLVLLPLAMALSLKVLGIQGVLAGILLLEAAMPTLASASAYASRFGGDVFKAAGASFCSSLACLVSLPLIFALSQVWGLLP